MNREQKKNIIDDLSIKLRDSKNIYFTRIEGLDSVQTASLRKLCFDRGVSLFVVKGKICCLSLRILSDESFISTSKFVLSIFVLLFKLKVPEAKHEVWFNPIE